MPVKRIPVFVFELSEDASITDARQYLLDNYEVALNDIFVDEIHHNISLVVEPPEDYNLNQLTTLAKSPYFSGYELTDSKSDDFEKWEFHMPRTDEGRIDELWHHKLVKFPQAVERLVAEGKLDKSLGHRATDISVFQLDTGFSDHERLTAYPGYDTSLSKSFIETDMDTSGRDSLNRHIQGIAHATSTAFTFIGSPASQAGSITAGDEDHKRFHKKLGHGLFPFVRFVPLRIARSVFFNLNLIENSPKDMFEAVQYAIAHGANVLVLSMGGEGANKYYKMAADLAYQNGVLFVCASGSVLDALSGVIRPASEPNTIGVAGVTTLRQNESIRYIPLPEGCDGRSIDISAPAKWVYTAGKSEKHGDYYRLGIGSSQSAVHVAAAGALWLHYWKDVLRNDPFFVQQPSHIVDAFKWALDQSKYIPSYWFDEPSFLEENKGILDVLRLLDFTPIDYRNHS